MISDPQLELRPFQSSPADPNAAELRRILRERPAWLSARDLAKLTGWSDRQIRQLANASDGWIISGQAGYKHVLNATQEEVHHSSAWLISQGKQMIRRGLDQRRRAHSLIH